MENYCVKKYSVEELDKAQTLLTNYINSVRRTKIRLNHYIERMNECEKLLEANEGLRKVSEEVYLVNRKMYEDNIRDYKKYATNTTIEIENIENEIEELRKKYCL